MTNKYISICLLSALSLGPCAIHANEIKINKSIVTFENNAAEKKTITVFNQSPELPAYVQTVVREVVEPHKGTKSQMLPHDTPKDAGLFVTPSRQIIEAGSEGLVSIINVNKDIDKERVYRVDIKPIISSLDERDNGQIIKVLVAYDVLVYVQPKNIEFEYSHAYENNKIYIKNTGNAHITVNKGMACSFDNCSPLPEGNIFPGITAAIPIPKNTSYTTFNMEMKGQETRRVRFEKEL